jgi:disulfide oxidoreductase YuzD
VEEPETEAVVIGPREGFTETLRTNTALLRRKIKNQNLIFETMKIGKQTKTDVCVAYIKGIANDKIIEEVKRRLNRIDTDSILGSGYIRCPAVFYAYCRKQRKVGPCGGKDIGRQGSNNYRRHPFFPYRSIPVRGSFS